MTELRSVISGTHPLSEEVIQKILDYKYGRDLKQSAQQKFEADLQALISLQEELGFSVFSSGSLGLEDIIRPFTRSLPALKSYENLGDLPIVRWHYTNTFYRRPTLIERFPEESRVLLEDRHSISEKSSYSHEMLREKKSRIVLPGPITLSLLIDSSYAFKQGVYKDYPELFVDAGRFLSQEVEKLPPNYVELQFDEPLLVWQRFSRRYRSALKTAYEFIEGTTSNRQVIVNTYFADVLPQLKYLLTLPVDGIGIDVLSTNVVKLSQFDFEGKVLQVGLLDSQNYLPTETGALDSSNSEFLRKIVHVFFSLSPKELLLAPNTGLEYLPRPIADAKLRQLSEIVKEVE